MSKLEIRYPLRDLWAHLIKASLPLAFVFLCIPALAQNEVISEEMTRMIVLNLKEEQHAAKYLVEIYKDQNEKPTVTEVPQARWEGRLVKGSYRSRFKVIFLDETESVWSDFFAFKVGDYQLGFSNLDKDILPLASGEDGRKTAYLSWNQISDARTYRIYYRLLVEFELDKIHLHGFMKKTSVEIPRWVAAGESATGNISLELPGSGLYEFILVGKDEQGKVIAKSAASLRAFELARLAPKILSPKDDFVRQIEWRPIPGFKTYKVRFEPIEDQSVDLAAREGYFNGDVQDHFWAVSESLPGGRYRLCVSTLVDSKTYSSVSCRDVLLRQGDRSELAQKAFYQNIQDQKSRLYYHQFELIASSVKYESLNPSLSSLVTSEGNVLNLSYTKSNPGEDSVLNEFYKLNLGFLGIADDYNLTYDLRYGRQYSNMNYYPFLFKANFGGSLDQMYSAVTDSKTAQALELYNHGLVNAFVEIGLQYDVRGTFAVDLRLGRKKPLLELYKSGGSDFVRGEVDELSLRGIFNINNSHNRIEFGYLYKSERHYFAPEKDGFGSSSVDQTGHYLSVGYTMETE